MKFVLILGQPRNGKSTLAKLISKELNIPIFCTDKYRREWGYHEPHKGYITEINPSKQKEFYDKLKFQIETTVTNSKIVIIEGSAINIADVDYFNPIYSLYLLRNISPIQRLEYSRKYDMNCWTCQRDDNYLLKLFAKYDKFSAEQRKINPSICVDITNFNEIYELADIIIEYINSLIKMEENNGTK